MTAATATLEVDETERPFEVLYTWHGRSKVAGARPLTFAEALALALALRAAGWVGVWVRDRRDLTPVDA